MPPEGVSDDTHTEESSRSTGVVNSAELEGTLMEIISTPQ